MRKSRKTKIPKNKSIEEFVKQQESTIKIESMQQVIETIENRRKTFIESLKNENQQLDKKMQIVYARKDAQLADEKRKEAYIKGINRIQEREQEEK